MSMNWTCPFCPLRCDDLGWPAEGGLPTAAVLDCPLAAQGVKRAAAAASAEPRPRVDGQAVDWETAIAQAVSILDDAPLPVIRGCMPDIATARAAIHLAQRFDGAVMHDETESLMVLRQAIARDGVITATLGDLRRHADLVVLVGDVLNVLPRFAARFLPAFPAAGDGGRDQLHRRRCVWLDTDAHRGRPSPAAEATGSATDGHVGAKPPPLRIEVPAVRLERSLAAVRLQLRGAPSPDEGGPSAINGSQSALDSFVPMLRQASYVAVVVSPSALDGGGGEAVASGLVGLVADLNVERRAVLIAPDPAATFRQVAGWVAGFGGPHRWIARVPQPASRQQLTEWAERPAAVTVDLEIGLTAPVAQSRGSAIRIRRQAAGSDVFVSEVELPVGTPGIDSAGVTVRGDGSVTLPLRSVRQTGLRQAAELLSEIGERFAGTTATAGHHPET